jgi:hypothetical protein
VGALIKSYDCNDLALPANRLIGAQCSHQLAYSTTKDNDYCKLWYSGNTVICKSIVMLIIALRVVGHRKRPYNPLLLSQNSMTVFSGQYQHRRTALEPMPGGMINERW